MTRIIGGSAGGRRLRTPPGAGTRPTSDRVREALFSSLEARFGSLTGLRFLDLYAGSGAVGLEAMSRGAAVVTAVEADRRTAALIEANAGTLGFDIEVVAQPVGRFLAAGRPDASCDPYDVVFLDPPYPMPAAEVDESVRLLGGGGWTTPGSVLVVERSGRGVAPTWPDSFGDARLKKYGETALWYVQRIVATRPVQEQNTRSQQVRRAVCPGSFDPVTNGHIDIVSRASQLFDEVVVAIGVNKAKADARLFTAAERMAMLEETCAEFPNVTVAGFDGLLTTFCEQRGIRAIVKGLRAVSDFDYELQMAQMNSSLVDVETVFIPTSPEYSFLASSLVKEVAMFGGDVSTLVPASVLGPLLKRLAEKRDREPT